jgi:hypothetical protein
MKHSIDLRQRHASGGGLRLGDRGGKGATAELIMGWGGSLIIPSDAVPGQAEQTRSPMGGTTTEGMTRRAGHSDAVRRSMVAQ